MNAMLPHRLSSVTPIGVAATVIAVDAATKALLYTPVWAEHERTTRWAIEAAAGLAVPVALFAWQPLRFAAALLFAGVFGNLLSATHGPVGNPLLVQYANSQAAFNVADVALVIGAVTAVCCVPRLIRVRRAGLA